MVTTDSAFERLASVPLLRALPPDRLEIVGANARRITLRRGMAAFAGHDRADWVGVVASGLIHTATWSADGRRTLLWLAGPGDTFGERALFESTRGEQAEAADPSVVWCLPAAALRAELGRDATAAREVAEVLSARLRCASEALEDVVARDLGGRLARRLCEFSERFGVAFEPEGVVVTARITHEDLADMVGASREAVSRTLAEFRARGWLTRSPRGRHVVADLAALRAKAGIA